MGRILVLSTIIVISIYLYMIRTNKETLKNYSSDVIDENMNYVIKYINNAIKTRDNGRISKTLFSEEKYQQQILPLKNGLNYAKFIQNKIIKK